MGEPAVMHPYPTRIAGLRAEMADLDLPAMVITDLVNVRYLSGFTGSNASLGVLADDAFLVTDGRYLDQAAAECPDLRVVSGRQTPEVAVRELAAHPRIGVEANHMTLAGYDRLTANSHRELVPTTDMVERLRRHKDPGEVRLIAKACTIISDVLGVLETEVTPGLTERAVAQRLYWLVQDLGGDDIAFETIVASGPNSAIPHHSPTDRVITAGDLLKIDAGALLQGYHSDITRTYVVGAEPTPKQRNLHNAVRTAAAAARDLALPGVAGQEADAAARAVLMEYGFDENFSHGLGHGVGLQIHEAPMIGREATDTMALGDVLTIEPGAYLPGFGGVRVEDTLALTADGTDCLTTAARELISLG